MNWFGKKEPLRPAPARTVRARPAPAAGPNSAVGGTAPSARVSTPALNPLTRLPAVPTGGAEGAVPMHERVLTRTGEKLYEEDRASRFAALLIRAGERTVHLLEATGVAPHESLSMRARLREATYSVIAVHKVSVRMIAAKRRAERKRRPRHPPAWAHARRSRRCSCAGRICSRRSRSTPQTCTSRCAPTSPAVCTSAPAATWSRCRI